MKLRRFGRIVEDILSGRHFLCLDYRCLGSLIRGHSVVRFNRMMIFPRKEVVNRNYVTVVLTH